MCLCMCFLHERRPLKWYNWQVFDWTTLEVVWIVWRRRQTNGIREWNFGGSILVGENRSTWRKLCLNGTLFTTDRTWTGLISSPCLRGDRPATDRLSHGAAKVVSCITCTLYVTTNSGAVLTESDRTKTVGSDLDVFWGTIMCIIVYYNECRVHRALTYNPWFFLDMPLLLVRSALFRYSFHTWRCRCSHLHDQLKVDLYADLCLQRIRKPITGSLEQSLFLRTPQSCCCSSGVLPFVKVHFGTQLCEPELSNSHFPTYPQLMR
jgi:hypothetical protein